MTGDRRDADSNSWFVLHQPGQAPATIPLEGELTVGRDVGLPAVEGHLATVGDPAVSRLHALIIPKPAGWCVQATEATNGLFVNGRRLAPGAVVLLANRDEIRLGERTTLVFHTLTSAADDRSNTQAARPVPDLTPGERRVLLAMCAPVLDGDAFTPPASVQAIAGELYVTESAVKQQLGRLYLKFDVLEGSDRRLRLANEALVRGAVSLADLRSQREDS